MARNLVKYSAPDRAAVAQYVDIEAACRAALDGEATGGIVISGGGAGGADTPSGGGQDGSDASDDGGAAAIPSGGDGGAGGAGGSMPGDGAEPGAGQGAATPVPSAILADSLADTSADAGGPSLLSGAPLWLLLAIGALVAAGATATVKGRTRPRP